MKINVINKKKLTNKQEEVLQRLILFQQGIIDKDFEKLNEIIHDNYTLTHMSGKTQTKHEFINDIMNGTLNYYKSIINNPNITIYSEKAIIRAYITLDAKVYGIQGTWTLHSIQTMEKTNDKWYISKWET